MPEFFGRAVVVAWHLALGVSFRAISLPENFITNGELSSLFRGEAHASSRAQFGAASSAFSVTGLLRPQRLHAKRSVPPIGLCALPKLFCCVAVACFRQYPPK